MTTPTIGFLLRPYGVIIHRWKNYIKKYGVQSLGSRTSLATIDMGQTWEAPTLLGRELGPHIAQCRLGWGLPPYQVTSWSIQPFGHNRYGPKIGGSAPFWGWGAGSLSNTMSLVLRPTSLPSGILIHPAIWPQQILAENWGMCPFGEGELGPYLAQCGLGGDLYLHA